MKFNGIQRAKMEKVTNKKINLGSSNQFLKHNYINLLFRRSRNIKI